MSGTTNQQYQAISYRIQQAKKAIELALQAGKVPMVWGSYGIGKTSIVRQIAEEQGYDSAIVITPSQDDVIDYKLPYVAEGEADENGQKIKMSAFAYSDRLPRSDRDWETIAQS